MSQIEVSVPVAKEAYELGLGISDFVQAVKTAVADGWQPGQDIPAILVAAFEKLVPAVQGADQIPSEMVEKKEFSNAVYLGLSPIIFGFVK